MPVRSAALTAATVCIPVVKASRVAPSSVVDLGPVYGGAEAAQDGDAECVAELGAGLRQSRRRSGLLGRGGADDQAGAETYQRPAAEAGEGESGGQGCE